MKIIAFALHANNGWPELGTDALAPGLNVIHGPSASGKTTLGRPGGARPVRPAICRRAGQRSRSTECCRTTGRDRRWKTAAGSSGCGRSHDEAAGERLTVAALDHSAVDEDTVRQLVACLSPSFLRPLFAVSFRETPRLDWLLSPEFSHEFRAALWRLKWAPPTVQAELRPIYGTTAGARDRSGNVGTRARLRRVASRNGHQDASALRGIVGHRISSPSSPTASSLRLQLGDGTGVAKRSPSRRDLLSVDALWSTQRDQVYLSLCLALVSALGRHGARLPLVLDEPFARLDARSSAAMVDVLHAFTARGQQVLVFTAEREAAERCGSLGAMCSTCSRLRSEHARRHHAASGGSGDAAGSTSCQGGDRVKHREAG